MSKADRATIKRLRAENEDLQRRLTACQAREREVRGELARCQEPSDTWGQRVWDRLQELSDAIGHWP